MDQQIINCQSMQYSCELFVKFNQHFILQYLITDIILYYAFMERISYLQYKQNAYINTCTLYYVFLIFYSTCQIYIYHYIFRPSIISLQFYSSTHYGNYLHASHEQYLKRHPVILPPWLIQQASQRPLKHIANVHY